MIRIRTGASWKHDPGLRAALRLAPGAAGAAAARAAVDALAIEVDGFDIAAGLAEGRLLPTLEALLRAVARVVGGAPHATVAFQDGALELVIRRRGPAALLTVVALSRPSRVLARDVEVEVEALAAAALEASAEFCRDLASLLPEGAAAGARGLRAAERALRRADQAPERRRAPSATRQARGPRRPGRMTFALEIADEDGQLLAYEGGRPDLGSLLVAGRLLLRNADGVPLAAFPGIPFLALRDLGAAVDRLLVSLRRREARLDVSLARPGRAGVTTLALDLEHGSVSVSGGPALPCPPLELARAVAEAALELGRLARARNPRQAENAHVAELEAAASERLAQIAELAEGDRTSGTPVAAAAPAARPVSQRPLGPGRLRRLSFRRAFEVDVGAPVGEGLHARAGVVVATGRAAVAVVERATGAVLWRAAGADHASVLPGAVLIARGDGLEALALRTGRRLWARVLPSGAPSTAFALAHGPHVLVGPGTLTGLDPASGRTLWRLDPPGAAHLLAAPFGGIAVAAADTGLVYGVDAGGRLAWRVRGMGAALHPPAAALGMALVVCAAGPGAAAIGIEPSDGARRFEAQLDFAPSGAPRSWGPRVAIAGAVAGDPIVAVLERDGAAAWVASPPLSGAPAIAATGPLLVARDPGGALLALGRDGGHRWSRPAPAEPPPSGAIAPAIARGTVVAAGDGIAALDARTGEIVGAVGGVAPVRLALDASLALAALDADGLVTGWRLATHLSVL
jgi:outer membrane protein assembly factor BamB